MRTELGPESSAPRRGRRGGGEAAAGREGGDEARVWDWDWGQWRDCVGLEREPRRKPETEKKHGGGV
jgi:hypothetical protein